MIIFQKLTWDNIFSYGENNSIHLDKEPLTQIMGDNGNGKSAISLILQEVLYGKNVKNIKKEDLFNRYLPNPTIRISLDFVKDNDKYKIELTRQNNVKLKLLKNDLDISSHTATGTYKQIQDIIGFDFKTFVQVTSQSSTSGLAFLTATDTTRKAFLINFLNLEKYTAIHEFFKNLVKEQNNITNEIKGNISTIEDWIRKHKEIDTNFIILKECVSIPEMLYKRLAQLENDYNNAAKINKEISKNEQYKALLSKIPINKVTEKLDPPEDTTKYKNEVGKYEEIIRSALATKKVYESLGKICHTCGTEIDEERIASIIESENLKIYESNIELAKLNDKLNEINEYTKIYNSHISLVKDFEELITLIDNNLSNEYVDKDQTEKQIVDIRKEIEELESEKDKITQYNLKAEAHNSKVKVITEQLEDYDKQLKEKEKLYLSMTNKLTKQEIIKDAFSTKGIVAYKIESLIKDLEKLINTYLSTLSGGKFLINFILSGDKLNIDIITEGTSVVIESLSSGELSRVNVATLLALRKMMNAISSNKINILFLDEITAVLDSEGKELLVDILMVEQDLNTFLIAHDYAHPLIPMLNVTKENNISKVADG